MGNVSGTGKKRRDGRFHQFTRGLLRLGQVSHAGFLQ